MDQTKVKLLAVGSFAACLLVVIALLFLRPETNVISTDGGGNGSGTTTSAQNDSAPNGNPRIIIGGGNGGARNGGEEGSTTAQGNDANPDAAITTTDGDATTTGSLADGGPGGSAGGAGALALNQDGTTGSGSGPGSVGGIAADGSRADGQTGPDGTRSGGSIDGEAGAEDDTDREPEEDEVLIAGRVLRGEEPVAEAFLTLNHSGGVLSASTDAEGSYRFAPAKAGEIALFLQSPASPLPRRRMTLQAGDHRLSEDFVIPPTPPVEGDVVHMESGERIADAEVRVYDGNALVGSVRSAEDGTFKLFPLKPGAYRVEGLATGYLPGEKAFEVFADKETPRVYLELSGSRVASGVVLDSRGMPVSGALVGLFGAWAYSDPFSSVGTQTSDGAGRFRFSIPSDPNLTEFRVGAYKQGLTPGFSETYNANNLEADLEILVRLPAGGTISGRLVEGSEIVVDGAEISVREGYATTGVILQRFNVAHEQKTNSGADGRFSLGGVEAGSTEINIAAEGYLSQNLTIDVVDGQVSDLGDVQMEGEEGARPGRIFGVIIDDRGNPLRDHAVLVRGANTGHQESTRTDPRGKFKIDGLPDDSYAIFTNGSMLRGEIFIVVDQTNPFVRAGDDQVYLVYDLMQSARVRVRNASGQPVNSFRVGVRIRYQGPQGAGGVNETFGLGYEHVFQSSDGTAMIEHLLAGTADFTFSVEGEGTEEVSNIQIPVGGSIDLGDVVIGAGATLTGKVVSATDGSSVQGMRVQVLAPENAAPNHPLNVLPQETQTGVDGRFEFRGLPVGGADVVLRKSGFVTERIRGYQIQAGQTNDMGQIVAQPSTTLRGRVSDPEGRAIQDVQITAGGETVFTDRDGRYYIDTISAGSATIIAFDHGGRFQQASVTVTLNAGQPNVADLTMQPVVP